MEGNVVGAVTPFITIVILIGIAPVILGNTTQNCENVPGDVSNGTLTGWAKSCEDTDKTTRPPFNMMWKQQILNLDLMCMLFHQKKTLII